MFREKNMRLVLGVVLVAAVMGSSGSGIAGEKDRVNLLPNPGFEVDQKKDGLPDRWSCLPAKGEAEGAIGLDKTEKHSGESSVRITHKKADSYSRILTAISESKPNTDYVASCWIKVDEFITLHQPKSAGVKLFIGDAKGSTLSASNKILKTAGRWQRAVVTFNTGEKKMGSLILYLHQGKGTVWFDDIELTEGTEPIKKPEAPKAGAKAGSTPGAKAGSARFPKVAHRPVTVDFENTFYLIKKEVLQLSFFYEKAQPETGDLDLVIDLPQGVVLHTIFDVNGKAHGQPAGKSVSRKAESYTRYVLPVPPECLRESFRLYDFQALIVEAEGSTKEGEDSIYWHLKDKGGKGEEHQMKLVVLPAMAPMKARPEQFRIIPCYPGVWGRCPKDAAYNLLFERMFDFYVKSGISGSFVPIHAVTRENKRLEMIQQQPWVIGGMAGWHPDIAKMVIPEEELKKVQAIDENGNPYRKKDPCPTYCLEQNALEKMARRYLGFLTGAYLPGYADPASFKETDFFSLDWEPNRAGWTYCYDQRCLEAFSAHSGISLEGLTPQKIKSDHMIEWIAFRGWQSLQMVGQFAKVVKEVNPKLQFAYCSSGKYHELIDPIADFHFLMLYKYHPVQLFEYVNEHAGDVEKPFLPLIDLDLSFDPRGHWESPKQLKIKILLTAAAGGEGIMFWHDMSSLGGLHFVKIRECSDIMTRLEGYYFDGKRADETAAVRHVEGGDVYRSTVHKLGSQYLISILNLYSRGVTTLDVKFPGIGPGKYSLYDPIGGTSFSTPSKGRLIWKGEDLKAGLSLDIPALEARYLILKPYESTDKAARTLRPGKSVKADTDVPSRTTWRTNSWPNYDTSPSGAATWKNPGVFTRK